MLDVGVNVGIVYAGSQGVVIAHVSLEHIGALMSWFMVTGPELHWSRDDVHAGEQIVLG